MTETQDRIALVFELEQLEIDENAGIARYRMSLDAARRHAQGTLAAADGLERVEQLEVRGQG